MRLNENLKIRKFILSAICFMAVLLSLTPSVLGEAARRLRPNEQKDIQLPEPNRTGKVSVEAAINARRSSKEFVDAAKFPLNFAQLGQLAWAGQGITDSRTGLRAAHSAGDIYPLELYFVTRDGLFIYVPLTNTLKQISTLDLRKQLSSAALGQGSVEDAYCDIVIAGSVRKVALKYGSKAPNLIRLEAGYAAQNIQLEAVAMGLTSAPIGDFEPRNVAKVCELPNEYECLLIVCVGYPFVQEKPMAESLPAAKLVKKAVLIVPESQYTDAELFDTQRILTEAGIKCVLASSKIGALRGTFGGLAGSEVSLDKLNIGDYDAVVFIGGPGASEYFNNPLALKIVREAAATNKIIAAISSAPMILANAGVLRGVKATGLPQQREQIKKAGAQFTGSAVERDGLIITANDPAVTMQFARAIAAELKPNQQKSEKAPAK